MTVRDLIDALEDYAKEFGDETVVRLAHQPRWAFEYGIGEVVAVTLSGVSGQRQKEPVIYIGEAGQIGYLPAKASVALGWSEAHDDEDDDEDEVKA